MSGWIKIHRKMLDNPIVCKDSEYLAVWAYILLNATHKEHPSMFQGNKIVLKPGQLITGRKTIAEKFKISESKVQRILKSFENEHQIEQQNGNKNRLITILSWDEYQGSEQQDEREMNNSRTTTEQQLNTYKNKRIKEQKNERSKDPKKEYADYVFLTETEYDKLTELLGEDERDRYFLRFASWISGKSKQEQDRRSAYLTILNWQRNDSAKTIPFPAHTKPLSKAERVQNKLDQLLKEAEEKGDGSSGYYKTGQDLFG